MSGWDEVAVTVERSAGTDRYGNQLPGGTSHRIDGCLIAPRSSEERTDRQATVITGRSLYAPPGADLRSQDVVVFSASPQPSDPRWQVDGEPGDWGVGLEAVLTRVEG